MEDDATLDVRAFLHLAPLVGRDGRLLLRPGPGATVGSVARSIGLDPGSLGLVMVNGRKADMETPLSDGDRVAYFPDYVPFHRVYGMCVL